MHKKGKHIRKSRNNEGKDKYIQRLINSYDEYSKNTRGLAPGTRKLYCNHIRNFLISVLKENEWLDNISPCDLIKFIVSLTQEGKSKNAKQITYSLRSFFRFLNQTSILKKELVECIPTVASWKHTTFPLTLTIEEIQKLLDGCDKTSKIGLRDYAILILLIRLGLRACEVCRLTLNDLDWEKSEIIIYGKGNVQTRFPIFNEVGEALANYLQHSRPNCLIRNFFVCLTTPIRGIQSSSTIRNVVRNALRRAGLNPEKKGSHLLRHTFAKQLLDQGATLQDIAIVLQHKSISTTAIYARVDFDKLKMLATSWPEKFNCGGK